MTDDILVKYLLGEASDEEQVAVQGWVDSNAENKRYFEHFKLIWEQSEKLAAKSTVDEHAAWERFQQRIAQKENAPKVIALPRRQFTFMRAAAAILVLVFCGWLGYFFLEQRNPMLALESGNGVLKTTLPDGTVVTLNKSSTLSYPKKFKGGTRTIALNGEAFFDVTPDKTKPFIINVKDVTVEVVGTSFNVKSTEEKTVVVVETGIVTVAKNNKGVKLNPKEMATVMKNQSVPVKQSSSDELYNYYRTQEFVCDNTPLRRLVDVLNEAYGVQIVIADKRLDTVPISAKFRRDDSIDNILKVISETLNIRVEKNGAQIILK